MIWLDSGASKSCKGLGHKVIKAWSLWEHNPIIWAYSTAHHQFLALKSSINSLNGSYSSRDVLWQSSAKSLSRNFETSTLPVSSFIFYTQVLAEVLAEVLTWVLTGSGVLFRWTLDSRNIFPLCWKPTTAAYRPSFKINLFGNKKWLDSDQKV